VDLYLCKLYHVTYFLKLECFKLEYYIVVRELDKVFDFLSWHILLDIHEHEACRANLHMLNFNDFLLSFDVNFLYVF